MFMESVTCGYHAGSPSSLLVGGGSLSPSEIVGYPQNGLECSPQLFAETQYAQTGYSRAGLSCQEDPNNNPSSENVANGVSSSYENYGSPLSSPSESLENENLVGSFSSLRLAQGAPAEGKKKSTGSRKTKKTSRSKRLQNQNNEDDINNNGLQEEDEDKKNRKDSFVYDVRLPNEQYLFFVPDLDLVKSHLMFAVREEVEVLKERIVELTDKIHNLESENKLLRQYAPQDTIQQVQQQLPPPTQHSSTSS